MAKATTTKTKTKKASEEPTTNADGSRFLFDRIEMVEIRSLKPHPKNPRVGNVAKVKKSLELHGQYKPIVVNKRNGLIAAGHHTWLAARELGWETIGIIHINVDETKHREIMLIDNKSADDGTYDDLILAEVLAEVATTENGLDGTGYDAADLQDLIDSVGKSGAEGEDAKASLEELMSSMPKMDMTTRTKRDEYQARREADDDAEEADTSRGATKAKKEVEEEEEEDIEDVEAELQAVLEVKVEKFNFWQQSMDDFQICDLRDDMLLEEIPQPLKTWGGHEATPDDGESWYFANYSLGGIKGLPFDRTILAFNTYDSKFEGWWEVPAWYTAKYMHKGIRKIVVPDFSFYYSQPRAVHLWNVYRAQWLGRFFQESGLKVAPRLQFNYLDPRSLEVALRGIPVGCPVLATSQQNIEDEKAQGPLVTKMLREALDVIKPESIIYYSGPAGKRAMEAVKYKGEVTYLENYAAVRRSTVFDKKEGLAGKGKNRKKALEKARKRLHAEDDDSGQEDQDE